MSETSMHSVIIAQPSEVHIDFHPESTIYLVPNVPNRIYFETFTDFDGSNIGNFKSASLISKNLKTDNETVILSNITCDNMGRGSFEFVPRIADK